MRNEPDLRLVGLGASPYTRKLRAALRFRRLPFRFVVFGSREAAQLPPPPLPLLPYLVVPGADGASDQVLSDTTPILNALESRYPGRPLRPGDPVLRLLDLILEDYGDEWLSKCMFHYRWSHDLDTRRASAYLPYAQYMQMSPAEGAAAAAMFAQRQISRIGVVGSNPVTAPVIEASWRRFLALFDAHIQQSPFLLGARPGAGDFAIHGQMTMLVITDPTPSAVACEVSPRAYAWTERCEDLSGLDAGDADWMDPDCLPATLTALLAEIGRTYVPVMLANAEAVAGRRDTFACEVDGQPWTQDAFVYQAKCLGWLREAHAALPSFARDRLDKVLAGTGCDRLFARA